MQMAYGDKNLFYKFFKFIIEKFDFLVEMPPEREVKVTASQGLYRPSQGPYSTMVGDYIP